MSREARFLQRLVAKARGELGRTTSEDVVALAESVRDHLTRLLNSRHGMSETLPDYGIPALVDMATGATDAARNLQQAIQQALRYEKRLRNCRVNLERSSPDEKGRAKTFFRLQATLVSQTGDHRVWYEVAVEPSGALSVKG